MEKKISVIGTGYVGLPLSIGLSRHYPILSFDINKKRISDLAEGYDRNLEFSKTEILASNVSFSADIKSLEATDVFIITVPTPIKKNNAPDLTYVKNAFKLVSKFIQKNNIVVLESTVYPGITEEMGKIIEKNSGLVCGLDFHLGYSPERFNPGDKNNNYADITKIVSAQNEYSSKVILEIYSKVFKNIHIAPSIKIAESSKLLENIQRDVNIALINEFAMVLAKDNISILEVLEAAKTKWNFLNFIPGLVGGHCISVDPYYYLDYLGNKKQNSVVRAAREINEKFEQYVFNIIYKKLEATKSRNLLVLGLSFKENTPDIRNSKTISIIKDLEKKIYNLNILIHDPLVDSKVLDSNLRSKFITNLEDVLVDTLVITNSSDRYKNLTIHEISKFLSPSGTIIDIKGILIGKNLQKTFDYNTL